MGEPSCPSETSRGSIDVTRKRTVIHYIPWSKYPVQSQRRAETFLLRFTLAYFPSPYGPHTPPRHPGFTRTWDGGGGCDGRQVRKKETTALEGIQMDGAREGKNNREGERCGREWKKLNQRKSFGVCALRAAHTLSFPLIFHSRKFGEQRE